jgi:hypothetical protein
VNLKRKLLNLTLAAMAITLVGPAAASAECMLPGNNDGFEPQSAIDFDGPNFPASQAENYVQIPFTVPAGTTAIRVRYCYENPPAPAPSNTIDLGVFEPKPGAQAFWDLPQRRGWSGSSRRDIVIAVNGFSGEAAYLADKDQDVDDTFTTTRAYRPGPIPAGEWAVELGLGALSSTDLDGVDWDLQVQLTDEATQPEWDNAPYAPDPYAPNTANPNPGWYEGDFHVHGEQEPGNATTTQTLNHAFNAQGIDFVTLIDHNNDVARGELGRYQDNYPGKLVIPGVEVTTYDGHFNNQNQHAFVDYRMGSILRLDDAADTLDPVRGPATPASQLALASSSGGFSQINHPTTFPEAVYGPTCRGCAWDYTDAETGFGGVDAIEVHNSIAELGPAPNPFTASAIAFYEHALDTGAHIAAVASTDAHKGPASDATSSAVGDQVTAVFATELSQAAINQAVKADHTYAKVYGPSGPDIRLTATYPSGPTAIIGDSLKGPAAQLTARVIGAGPSGPRPGPWEARILRNGVPIDAATATVDSGDFTFRYTTTQSGRYSLEVVRVAVPEKLEVYSSPIWFTRAKPSNRFRILGYTKKPRKGTGVLRVRVPSGGKVRLRGGAVRRVVRSPGGPKTLRLPVRLKPKAKARLVRRGSLRVPVKVTFTPRYGDPRTKTRKVTLVLRRRSRG